MAEPDSSTKRLRTIPGVGPRLSEAVVAWIDDPSRFRNARAVGSYVGLVPRRRQSGTNDHSGRVTKQGPGLLRKLLVEVAWIMRQHNPHAEATHQFAFCKALLEAAKAEGISTCLDTSGQFASDRLLELVPLVDVFHYDFKLGDAAEHTRWMGVNGRRIKRNLDLLIRHGCRVRLRCPIIPGVNDHPQHREVIDRLRADDRFETVEELPYHATGTVKYHDLGREAFEFDPTGSTQG